MLSPVRNPSRARLPRPQVVDLPQAQPDPRRIAVLLNRNARRITDSLARDVEHIAGRDHVFESHNLDEAEAFSREIVQRGYGTVVCGGGDGTLMRAFNLVRRYVGEANAWRIERYRRFGERQALLSSPRFAFLPLGTGNGMRRIVGGTSPKEDLRRIVDYVPSRTVSLPLIDLEGEQFFFGGLGYDSQILEDYNWLKARAKSRVMRFLMQNVTGYLLALFARSVPRLALGMGGRLEGRVVNRGRAYFVDPRRGDFVEEVAPGTTLFEGRAHEISAGTTSFFGYGFKMYPFARMMPGMMQLRVAALSPLPLLPAIPKLWQGHYRNPRGLYDFLVEDVSIELERPFPFQHSGDAQGLRDRLDLRIADQNLELVDLYPPPRFS